jgi:UDP-N-acetylglucosamine 2-epimerase
MKNQTVRILVVFGTRPEIIKLGPVCRALRRRHGVAVDTLWTGQHQELAAGLLELFDLQVGFKAGARVMEQPGLGSKLGAMTAEIERVLKIRRYDWIVVQGDTATATAAAMAGFLNRTPVAHVEAGLRTNDMQSPWPEEFNRRVISLASAMHFAPTARAAANLRNENVPLHCIRVVGNTVVDALLYTRERLGAGYRPIEPAVANLPADRKLVLATTHRRENIGASMRNILRALRTIGEDGDKMVALPVHLNPDVKRQVREILSDAPNVHLLPPLQYPDFVHLLSKAWCVVSDSGGVQEEAPTFGVQILITRDTTERPEVVEAGFGRLIGSDHDAIVSAVRELTSSDARKLLAKPNPFGAGDAGESIASELVAQARAAAYTGLAA